ncbi:MAG: phage virion morphogenesis protein [Rhodospirillaceae bacterium]|nr:phage virion morphogenesis protein [Rhodospirillaceae bacterium]
MNGASITFNVNGLVKLAGRTKRFLDAAADKTLLLETIGSALVANVRLRFDKGQAPDGTPWLPVKRGGSPLNNRGLLRDSNTYAVGSDSVRVGTNHIEGPVHQFGATIRPKKAKALAFTVRGTVVFAKKVTIPARPFLGIGPEDKSAIRGSIADVLRLARQRAN